MFYLKEIMAQLGFPVWAFGILVVILIWSSVWKFLALWKSARKGSVVWFIIFALVNTVGILEILYIFVFSKMKLGKKKEIPKARKKRR